MYKLTASINNKQSEHVAYLKVPSIEEGSWENETGTSITEAQLGDTVYFRIKTLDISSGEKLNLRLYDYDHLLWINSLNPDEGEFDNEPVKMDVVVSNGIAKVQLDLPLSWTKSVKDGYGKLELYWDVTYGNRKKSLPEDRKQYLDVRYSEQELFVKPSEADPAFPDMYSMEGEIIVPLELITGEITDEIKGRLEDVLANFLDKSLTKKYVLTKLQKGYLVASDGRVYQRSRTFQRTYLTDSNGVVTVNQSADFEFRTRRGGKMITVSTKDINQYDFFYKSASGNMKMRVLATMNFIDAVWSLTEMCHSFMTGSKSLPLPGPFAILGIMGENLLNQIDTDLEQKFMEDLAIAKSEGFEAVMKILNSGYREKYKMGHLQMSLSVATRIIAGELKTLSEVESAIGSINTDEPWNVEMLYRNGIMPGNDHPIKIVEAFFMNDTDN
ncbi:MAG: hypothetical protein LBV74_00300 [Tannerella sp.]|jgi:hypothetical protein|nr:hypothetical protein [Tannerella sp.]